MSKCFCHLNGYEVKDKEARTAISTINMNVGTLQTDVEALKNNSGSGKLYHGLYSLIGGYSTTDSDCLILSLYSTATLPTTLAELVSYIKNTYGGYANFVAGGYIVNNGNKEPILYAQSNHNGTITAVSTSGQVNFAAANTFNYRIKEV